MILILVSGLMMYQLWKSQEFPRVSTVELLDYPGDKVDFYEGSTRGYT